MASAVMTLASHTNATLQWLGKTVVKLSIGDKQFILDVHQTPDGLCIIHEGNRVLPRDDVAKKNNRSFALRAQDDRKQAVSARFPIGTQESRMLVLRSPIPGVVAAVHVKERQLVQEGQTLLLIEAMKMHNPVKAPGNGKIAKVWVKPGVSVESGTALVEIRL